MAASGLVLQCERRALVLLRDLLRRRAEELRACNHAKSDAQVEEERRDDEDEGEEGEEGSVGGRMEAFVVAGEAMMARRFAAFADVALAVVDGRADDATAAVQRMRSQCWYLGDLRDYLRFELMPLLKASTLPSPTTEIAPIAHDGCTTKPPRLTRSDDPRPLFDMTAARALVLCRSAVHQAAGLHP